MGMMIFWLGVLIVCLAVEAITMGLTTIWFAAGSLLALLAEVLGAPLWLQITLFVIVSIVLMVAIRPWATKFINGKRIKTNVETIAGSMAKVTETIDNIAGTGRVNINGQDWMARSKNGEVIETDVYVTVAQVEGVKVLVERK